MDESIFAHDWKIVYKIVYLNYRSFVKQKSYNPVDLILKREVYSSESQT